jgi:hypothetical protein
MRWNDVDHNWRTNYHDDDYDQCTNNNLRSGDEQLLAQMPLDRVLLVMAQLLCSRQPFW